jgi:hypothetical protein
MNYLLYVQYEQIKYHNITKNYQKTPMNVILALLYTVRYAAKKIILNNFFSGNLINKL